MNTKLINSKLPKRAASHRIDTRALRLILSQLNEDWVIRNVEERDYGIDLQVELFDEDSPTGFMALVQVKGTEKSLSAKQAKIPVKTLHYAELFSIPFFLFRTSLKDKETEFIWLQKYIATDLQILNPKWRTRTDLSIAMPPDNKLSKNDAKFKRIVTEQRYNADGLAFAKSADALRRFLKDAIKGETGKPNAKYCLEDIEELRNLIDFMVFTNGQNDLLRTYWKKTLKRVEKILTKVIAKSRYKPTAANLKAADELLYALDATMYSYLAGDDTYRALIYTNQKTGATFSVDPPF